ncbi:DUF1351 domain-containing protein [Thomasclavelia spiroformis]|uniref:DUF1351 domain-containing protein n=1 Tax=Thomasclavelia spiroformis TaxID=29348 RepID=UPI002942E516|nr:DUF1351 domain-containing protein [Thomasclavelia spiroformis]
MLNKLLGGYAAVRCENKKEFDKVIEILSIKNCFLANKEPVSKMSYPGDSVFALFRGDDGFIWWSPIKDVDTNKYQLVSVAELNIDCNIENNVIDANVISEKEVVDVNEKNMTLTVLNKPESSGIKSNVNNLVALIPAIEAKANVVVDENNYKTFIAKGTGLVPNLRKYAKGLRDEKKKIKDAYMASFDEFSNNVDSVINALETTAKKIDDEVKHFTDKQKEALRKSREDEINKLKEVLIENKMISADYANKFIFDEKWLNASCSMKRFKEEVEAQFNSLIEKEKLDKQNIELLETTIINTCSIVGIDDSLVKRDKYKTLIKIGQNLGEVTKMITDDINTLKKQKEALLAQQKKDAETINLEAEKIAQDASLHVSLGVPTAQPDIKAVVTMPVTDDKTGEVIGRVSGEQVTVKVQTPPPSVPEDKIFSYTYTFEGNCKAILTFNKCLKALSKVFKSFKYMEVK